MSSDSVSTSEVAKVLLECARKDRLDHRFEVAHLQRSPAAVVWSIRQKWEQQLGLSNAEWLLLARYLQVGCEEVAGDPECPKPESFAQVLEAFLALRALRLDRGVALDKYYLGNLEPTNRPPCQLDANGSKCHREADSRIALLSVLSVFFTAGLLQTELLRCTAR
jgi:hypothetical protein